MTSSTAYIVLFRGVGGKTQLPVQPLREVLRAAGFENVATYINSGNALVQSALPRQDILRLIAEVCEREFGFTKEIFILSASEWSALIEKNPFASEFIEPKHLHAVVLAEAPLAERVELVKNYAVEGESISIIGKVAYLHTPHGFGTSKLAVKFDKSIGVSNTARNWNTVLKLMQLVSNRNE